MKKFFTWLCIISVTIVSASICGYFLFRLKKKISSNYSTERLSTDNKINKNLSNENNLSNNSKLEILNIDVSADSNSSANQNLSHEQQTQSQQSQKQEPPQSQPQKESVISSFLTKIYNHESARQNNVQITCNSLNGKVIKKGETFSFCNTVGPATQNKGYQKADIFDKNGNKLKGFGGGNCQVSTTLYNAVLKIPSLKIVERHEHSSKVPYISPGKDAAVAYGSCDFKFKNLTGNDIKLDVKCDKNSVIVSIISIS